MIAYKLRAIEYIRRALPCTARYTIFIIVTQLEDLKI